MALRLPERAVATIEIPGGGEITVRALTYLEITNIYRSHKPDVEAFYKSFEGREASENEILTSALQHIPYALIESIAVAADVPDEVDAVATLPPVSQIEALTHVIEMTLKSFGIEVDDLGKMEGALDKLQKAAG